MVFEQNNHQRCTNRGKIWIYLQPMAGCGAWRWRGKFFSKFQINFCSCKNVCNIKINLSILFISYVGWTGPQMRWDRRQGQLCVSIPTCWYETPERKPSLVLNFYESPQIEIHPSPENILCFCIAIFSNACQCNVVRATGWVEKHHLVEIQNHALTPYYITLYIVT